MIRKKLYIQILAAFLAVLVFSAACGSTGGAEKSGTDEGGNAGMQSGSSVLSDSAPGTEKETEEGTEKETEKEKEIEAETDAGVSPETSKPAHFSFSGGTGKVKITCPQVTVSGQGTGGEAEAVLVFSSPHYEWVKADGTEYLPDNAEESERETSVFTIPVLLDEEMKISALTTAMSEPHEIEYTIFISLNAETQDSSMTGEPGESETGTLLEDGREEDEREDDEGEAIEENAIEDEAIEGEEAFDREKPENQAAPEIPGLTFVSEKKLAYAEAFAVYNYMTADTGTASDAASDPSGVGDAAANSSGDVSGKTAADTSGDVSGKTAADTSGDGSRNTAADTSGTGLFRLIDVYGNGGARYLLVPEGGKIPEDLQKALRGGKDSASALSSPGTLGKITVLQAPLDNLYVAATSSMALFDAAGAISQVKLTGTDAKGWYIDAPKRALESGSMVYAGKYSAPDYERLAVSGCDLAVESMMILHTPEVKEKLEELGIPVFIDTSSSESHPLGRTEWVRLYGVLTGHEKEADGFFEEQKKIFAGADSYTDTGKTAAFFSITSSGNVVVRAAEDYIPKMIELAGGHYIFTDLTKGTGNSASVRLSMEDFYNTAKDADYLIYNATIEKPVGSIRELCSKFALLSEFKAVQEGHVWQVRRSLYQSPDIAAQMITDLRCMLTEQNNAEMVFLEQVND